MHFPVHGEPGTADYFGPHWAKIEAKRDRSAKLQAQIDALTAQRAALEVEIATLITEARDSIDAAREAHMVGVLWRR